MIERAGYTMLVLRSPEKTQMAYSRRITGPFKLTAALRDHHNYRLNPPGCQRYLTRRSDRTLAYLDECTEHTNNGKNSVKIKD